MQIKRTVLLLIVLLSAIAALYGQFLWNPIVFDDLPFFMINDAGHQPVDDYRYSPFELRSLPYATLAWGKAAFGLDMLHFRIENLLLHAAVTITLFFFLMRLFDAAYGARADSLLSSRSLALFAALLFALHPVAVYAAGYLVQRTILMATLFSLLAMLAYLHGSMRDKTSWLWASVPLYYLAVFSKEHAIMLPAVLLALTVLLHDDWRTRLRQHWGLWLALAAIALFVVAASRGVLGSVYEPLAVEMLDTESNLNYPLSVLTQSWLFFKYAGLWLFPNPAWMSADMREPFAPSLLSSYLLAFVAFLAWGAGAVWLLMKRGRAGLVGLAMLFPWLMFMTELSTVRIQESFVLYRSYLWAVGACCLLPVLLDKLDKKIASVIVAVVALAMFPISMDRLASFGHPLMLWDDAEKLVKDRPDLPGAYRIYYNRGTELIKVDEYDLAIKDLTLAVTLHPDWPFSYNNLGSVYMKKDDWRAAANAFTQAIEIAERKKMGASPRPYYGRAMAYEAMGEIGKAREDYRVTCRLANKGCEKL
ncbi:MAG: tetratricopeptide repeat protein [Gallionella sp.]|nr:tetratricopeptide repeat protein [Gallionella sp.]